jgi:hypothetical protein
MVIDIIDILRVVVETEDHPPIGLDGHSPKAFHLALERMQAEPGQVHVGNGWGGVKRRQNIPQLANMFRVYAAWVIVFKEPFQPLVANCPYHILP